MLLYVSVILARRLDGANQTLVELMIQVDYPRKMIEKTAEDEGTAGGQYLTRDTICLTKADSNAMRRDRTMRTTSAINFQYWPAALRVRMTR